MPIAELSDDALARLAELCGIKPDELITELRLHTNLSSDARDDPRYPITRTATMSAAEQNGT